MRRTNDGTRLRPLPARKLADEVSRSIRDLIMSGAYAGGRRISVSELAQGLQVSTMPVREALIGLVHEGLVETSFGRGFQVASLEEQDVLDLFVVYKFLACQLAERALENIDERAILSLRRMTQRVDILSKESDSERTRAKIEDYNFQFHRTINLLVDAPRLHWFMKIAGMYIPRHLYETLPEWSDLTIIEHPEILAALEARDPLLVRERIGSHVDHASRLIVDNLQSRGFWADQSRSVDR